MTSANSYIIDGGPGGAERLGALARAMAPATDALLDRAGPWAGLAVLDLGCGAGHVTREIARRVGPMGRIVGIDMDPSVLAPAQQAAERDGLAVTWRQGRAEDLTDTSAYDVVSARFLLSHLVDPDAVLRRMRRALRPGGRVVLEDIDIAAHAHWPPSPAFQRYLELYEATGRLHGADPRIGPRLHALLRDAGFVGVDVAISMRVFHEGEGKTIARLTLTHIAETAIAAGLSNREEIDRLVGELIEHEHDPRSIQSTAQVFQLVGHVP